MTRVRHRRHGAPPRHSPVVRACHARRHPRTRPGPRRGGPDRHRRRGSARRPPLGAAARGPPVPRRSGAPRDELAAGRGRAGGRRRRRAHRRRPVPGRVAAQRQPRLAGPRTGGDRRRDDPRPPRRPGRPARVGRDPGPVRPVPEPRPRLRRGLRRDAAAPRRTGVRSAGAAGPEPGEVWRWVTWTWLHWYVALRAEATVLAGSPATARHRLADARKLTTGNPIVYAIVERAEALLDDDPKRLLATATTFEAATAPTSRPAPCSSQAATTPHAEPPPWQPCSPANRNRLMRLVAFGDA